MLSRIEWEEQERTYRRVHRMLLVLLVGVLLAFGFLLVKNADAGPVFRSHAPDGRPAALRLFNEPCVNEKVQAFLTVQVRPEFAVQFQRAVLTWAGKDWASCWMEWRGMVYSVDEEGVPFQPIPRSVFKDDSV